LAIENVFTAVAMSGSILRPWTTTKDPAQGTRLLATSLGCPTRNSTALMDCLKAQTVDQLLNTTHNILEKDAWVSQNSILVRIAKVVVFHTSP
jgi:Carboxylesterase family